MRQTELTRDIYCVKTWSKSDTHCSGVLIDDLPEASSRPRGRADPALVAA